MTATMTKPKETWRDWMPPGLPEPEELFTREELADLLHSWHIDASVSDLRYWEYAGVLPRPVRRWHNGAVRAVYPRWIASIVRELRRMQRVEGFSLQHIRPQLRAYARMFLAYESNDSARETVKAKPLPMSPEDIRIWPDLTSELERLARWWTQLSGVPAERIEVHVIGASGRATRYPLPLATESSEHEPEHDDAAKS